MHSENSYYNKMRVFGTALVSTLSAVSHHSTDCSAIVVVVCLFPSLFVACFFVFDDSVCSCQPCPACTYYNPSSSSHCQICGTALSSASSSLSHYSSDCYDALNHAAQACFSAQIWAALLALPNVVTWVNITMVRMMTMKTMKSSVSSRLVDPHTTSCSSSLGEEEEAKEEEEEEEHEEVRWVDNGRRWRIKERRSI